MSQFGQASLLRPAFRGNIQEVSSLMQMPLIHRAQRLSRLQAWCIALVLTVAAVTCSIAYLDRTLSTIAERLLGGIPFIANFVVTPGFFDPLVLLMFATFLFRRALRLPFAKADLACLLADISLILCDIVKIKMKYLFGRTWPKYESPSYIHDGAYGFHPFEAGHAYQSFPSGHVAAVCTLAAVLWFLYPRFRALYVIVSVGFAMGLVATNYHFLADVIAGGFLGASIGTLVITAWELCKHRVLARARIGSAVLGEPN